MKTWNEMTNKERDAYINQDYIEQKELLFDKKFDESRVVDNIWEYSDRNLNETTLKVTL